MARALSRPLLPALAATAALAVAGCGGGGDEKTYVKTYEGACAKIVAATKEFQTSLSGLGASVKSDPDKAVATIKGSGDKLFTTFGDQLDVMAKADAPSKFSDFQDSVSDNADKSREGIKKAKDALANIKTLQDFSKVGQSLDGIDVGGTKGLPKELGDQAPSCKTLGGSSTAS
ncbi:hypothetical protein [Patulibacter sp. SYSU D01012]|uniref:hypothetical protein n=1 Tax=Patulibacter sp. SYSU D01012 TaxID=2817381 RepID=UPI001B317297|nr:hypothetical protein [Patulibacter sp. SYSU D01012]